MQKTVRLVYGVCQWLAENTGVLDANWIISVVQWTPSSERNYYEDNRFFIEVRRKANRKVLKIVIRVEDCETEYVVLLVHMED